MPVRGLRLLDLEEREPVRPRSRRFTAIALSSSRVLVEVVDKA